MISLSDKDFSEAANLEEEVFMMRMCVHQYVIRILDSFRTLDEFHMVVERESGGTLYNYLAERNYLLKEGRAREIAHKLALGLEYMHE